VISRTTALIVLICSMVGLMAWARYEPLQLAGVDPSTLEPAR
jgi:hypothetical protein